MHPRLPIIEEGTRLQWAHGPMSLICVLSLVFSLCWITDSEAKTVEKVLVVVNDDIITKTELDGRLSKEKELRRQLYQYDEKRLSEEMEKVRPGIIELMIDEMLFIQEAVRNNILVSDAEIQQFIDGLIDQFGSAKALNEALAAEGYTQDSFKKEKKRTLLLQRLIEQKFGAELNVTNEAVKEFYRENTDQFPGRSDTVKLKHIFIKFHTTEVEREKALRRAENILKRCKEGADFGEMASEFSDNELTKASGGDMGYFIPGMGKHDPRLEEAASKLAVGGISDLIESVGGYDIIKVTDIKDNSVRAQRIYVVIYPDAASERSAEEKANSILEELRNGADFVDLAREHSDDPLAKDKDGDWKEIPINAMAVELSGAFDSFDEGEVSEPVKTPLGFHIFKIVKRQDLTDDEMEQLRELLRQKLLQEKLSEYSKKLREKAYIQKLVEDDGIFDF